MDSIAIEAFHGEARIDSRNLAAVMSNQHKNLLSLLDDYAADFQAIGAIAFETRPASGGGKPVRIAFLNEEQCYFLLTLVRNSDTTVPMKRHLVQAFTEFKRAAQAPAAPLPGGVGMAFLQEFAGNTLLAIREQATLTKDEVKTELRQEIADALGNRPIQGSQPKEIQRRAHELARLMGGKRTHYADAWRRLKDRFGIAAYRDLLTHQYDDALHFLDKQIDSYRDTDPPLLEGDP